MKRTGLMPLAVAALVGWASLIPAHAAPPTVTPSPGYDARLQEQRAATQRAYVSPSRRTSSRPQSAAPSGHRRIDPADAGTMPQ